MQTYVLIVCLDQAQQNVVTLRKIKGPAAVIGKINFPGGKLELHEEPMHAAIREFHEETGVLLPEQDLSMLCFGGVVDEYALYVYSAKTDLALQASTTEQEIVSVTPIAALPHPESAEARNYSPDFFRLLTKAQTRYA